MEGDEEDGKGKSKACPECKKMLLLVVNGMGKGIDIKMKCAYCKKRMLVQIGQKTFIHVTPILVFILLLLSAYGLFISVNLREAVTAMKNNIEFIAK